MMTLRKFEKKRLFKNTTNKITITFIIFLSLIYFYAFHYNYSFYVIQDSNGKTVALKGIKGIKYAEEKLSGNSGNLDVGTFNKINNIIEKVERESNDLSEDGKFLMMNLYRNEQSILKNINKGNFKLEKQSYTFKEKPIRIGYTEGWNKFLSSFSSIGTLCLCLFIIINFSTYFSKDKEYRVDSLIYTSKIGRTKLINVRIKTVIEVLTSTYLIVFILYFFLYGGIYGFQGGRNSIVSSMIFSNARYNISYIQLSMLVFFYGWIGLVTIGIMILAISSLCRKNLTSFIVSLIAVLFPIFFDFSGNIDFLQKVLTTMPIYSFRIGQYIGNMGVYFEKGYLLVLLLNLIITFIISILIVKFKNHDYYKS